MTMYSCNFMGSVSSNRDLAAFLVPSDMAIVLHRFVISQTPISRSRGYQPCSLFVHRATSISGGVGITARQLESGDPAFSGTLVRAATVGEGDHLFNIQFNLIAGLDKLWLPKERPFFTPGDYGSVRLVSAAWSPTTVNFMYTLYFETIGG